MDEAQGVDQHQDSDGGRDVRRSRFR